MTKWIDARSPLRTKNKVLLLILVALAAVFYLVTLIRMGALVAS